MCGRLGSGRLVKNRVLRYNLLMTYKHGGAVTTYIPPANAMLSVNQCETPFSLKDMLI